MRIVLYLLSIVVANAVTASLPPMNLFGFIVPMGTWLIGLSFVLRDFVQMKYGRKGAYLAILSALILSAIWMVAHGDIWQVVAASAISFAISESSDTEMFTRLNRSYPVKVLLSGLVGSVLDSALFVLVGLSPLFGANIVPWPFVASAILGQVLVKAVMQAAGAGVLLGIKRIGS